MSYAFHFDGQVPVAPRAVWVFGSNLAGRHGAGAAVVAVKRFGARYGAGLGAVGRSYAIPTKDAAFNVLPLAFVEGHVAAFLVHARANPGTTFFVTRVGCGLAGYRDAEIAPMFRGAPTNCDFAEPWRHFLVAPALA